MAKAAPRAMDNIFANMTNEAKKINEKEAVEPAVVQEKTVVEQVIKKEKTKPVKNEKKIKVAQPEKPVKESIEKSNISEPITEENLTKKNHTYTMDEDTYQLMSAIISVLRQNGITDETDKRPISESFYIRSSVRRENERIMNSNTEDFRKDVYNTMNHTPEKSNSIVF